MQLTSLAPRPNPIRSLAVDTRPLDVRAAGHLAMDPKDTGKRATPFLASASGIAGVGGTAWVVGDRMRELIRFDHLATPGVLDGGLPKRKQRYDFEAITTVPMPGSPGGASAVVAFGSGSADDRGIGIAQDVDARGRAVGAAQPVDMTAVYSSLGASLGARLNIEGAAFRQASEGLELLLFQRDLDAAGRSRIFRLDGAAVLAAARAGRAVGADVIRGTASVQLGQIDGAPLGFSDAKVLPDGRIAFSATGERRDDPTTDGEIVGSAFGILDADLQVAALRRMTGPVRKVEGIELATALDPSAPANRFVAVCDADDELVASEVVTFDM